jgi:hypothetical protein
MTRRQLLHAMGAAAVWPLDLGGQATAGSTAMAETGATVLCDDR